MVVCANHILILHSHKSNDRPTSEEVARQISYVALRKNYPEFVQLIPVPNRAKLFEVLEEIKDHTKDWLKPMIHFEMHGSPDGLGLSEESDIVTWEDLKEPIREINIISKNNLFVSLATCYGADFLKLYEGWKPCPFFGFVGPMIEVGERDLENSFCEFFTTLLQTDSFQDALFAIQKSLLSPTGQGQFAFTNCDLYFNLQTQQFKKQIANKELMNDWLEDLMIAGRTMLPDVPAEFQRIIFANKLSPKNLEQTFNGWRKTFLHQEL